MSTRSWIGGSDGTYDGPDDGFDDKANWSPTGLPQPGDTLDITNGTPFASNIDLNDTSIILGSTAGNTAQLWFSDMTVGSDTTISFANQQAPRYWNQYNFIFAASTNDGTIGLPTDQAPNTVINFVQFNGQDAINNGTINVGASQTAVFDGSVQLPGPVSGYSFYSGADLINNGQINVYGTLQQEGLRFQGTGTISLDGISQGLGLPVKPAVLLDDGNAPGGGGIGSGQTVIFNGGTLAIEPNQAPGTLLNFASTSLNMVQISDFTLSTYYMSGGVLNVTGISTLTKSSFDFTMPTPDIAASNAHFVVSQNGSNVDVTWNASAPVVGNYMPPRTVPHPIPILPPHEPPGYHLS